MALPATPRRGILRTAFAVLLIAPAFVRAADPEKSAPGPKKLLIIAPEAFRDALGEYLRYKSTVLPTDFVSLEAALKTDGVDDPERLKRYLYNAWKADKRLGYVLLVGDRDIMPVRYMVLDRATPAAFDYAFYPSDLYYGDLARDNGEFDNWNASKDGFHAKYFGEVRGEKNKSDPINFDHVHYRPAIAIGRWPVSTAGQLKTVMDKSISYEKSIRDGTHPGMRTACLFNVRGWVDARDELSRFAIPGWKMDDYFFDDGNARFKTPPPDERHVLAALNQGAGLVVHAGHGDEDSWIGDPADIETPRGRRLNTILNTSHTIGLAKNADRLPVMVSVGCSTNYFAPLGPYEAYVDVDGAEHKGTDHGEVFTSPPPAPAPYQKARLLHQGLGRSLLRDTPGGAVAYIGCDTGSQPCALVLLDGFMASLAHDRSPHLGECWAGAIDYYYGEAKLATLTPRAGDWYPPSIFFQGMKYMLFGDPSLPLAEQKD